VKYQMLRQYKLIGTITILYILIVAYLDSSQEEKNILGHMAKVTQLNDS